MKTWEMTYNQYIDYYLKHNRYAKQYYYNSSLWEGKQKDLLSDWKQELLKRAEEGSIPGKVIRSYINIFGQEELKRLFRGTKEKGLTDWKESLTKRICRESFKSNMDNLL